VSLCEQVANIDPVPLIASGARREYLVLDVCGLIVTLCTDIPEIAKAIQSAYDVTIAEDAKDPSSPCIFILRHVTPDSDMAVFSPFRTILARQEGDGERVFIGLRDEQTGKIVAGLLDDFVRERLDNHLFTQRKSSRNMLLDVLEIEIVNTISSTLIWPQFVHAASVSARGRGALICGISGAGKTTLALGLKAVGFLVLNDDITCVNIAHKMVHSYPRRATIRPHSALLVAEMEIGLSNATSTVASPTAGPAIFTDAGTSCSEVQSLIFLEGFGQETELRTVAATSVLPRFVESFLTRPHGSLPAAFLSTAKFVNEMQCYSLVSGPIRETVSIVEQAIR